MSTGYTLTEAQQDELRRCPAVKSATARMVEFTPEFKRRALAEYTRGISPETIFREAGVPALLLKKQYARYALKRWRAIARKHGVARFDTEHRGREGVAALAKWRDRQKAYAAMSEKEKVRYLEAEVEAMEHIRRRFQLPPSIHSGARSSRRRTNAASSPA